MELVKTLMIASRWNRRTWRTGWKTDRRRSRWRCPPAGDRSASGFASPRQVSIVVRRAAESSARKERKVRDVADARPPAPFVESRRIAAGDRVEHEERLAVFARGGFGSRQQ